MKIRYIFTILVSVAIIGALWVSLVAADNSWNGYHWASGNSSPTVLDKTSSSLYDVSAGVSEWASFPNSPVTPVILAEGKKGEITVTEAFNQFWYGQARVFLEDGHITKGQIKLNTRLLNPLGADAADHVLCQEIGHILGLQHDRTAPDTCMNDTIDLSVSPQTSPNPHDIDTLIAAYNHTDVVSGDGGEGGRGGGIGGPDCAGAAPSPRTPEAAGSLRIAAGLDSSTPPIRTGAIRVSTFDTERS